MGIGFSITTESDFAYLGKAVDKRRANFPEYAYGSQYISGSPKLAEPTLNPKISYSLMLAMYKNNVWVRAIVDKITKRTVAISHKIKPVNPNAPGKDVEGSTKKHIEEVEEFLINPNGLIESFSQIRKKLITDILIYDAGALEIVPGISFGYGRKVPMELYSVAGDTIRKKIDKHGNFMNKDEAYAQVIHGKEGVKFSINELLYLIQFPRAGYSYGCSPLETLQHTVTSELYASIYNADFFSNNATPRYAVLFKNMGFSDEPASEKMTRWLNYWDEELRGKPHRPILLGSEEGDIDFKTVGLSNEDMQFQEYSNWLLTKLMAVYGMQPLVMGLTDKSTGKLNSEQQNEQFKQDAIKPQLELFATAFNEVVIWNEESGFGYKDIYLDWTGIDKTDEKQDASINEIYARIGTITVNEVRERIGLPPVPWGNTAYVNQALIPIGTNPQIANPTPVQPAIKNTPGTGLSSEDEANVIASIITDREKDLNKFFSYPK